ncbi:uncharacterized protein LOC107398835 [Tribolium castaneum]|uniref:uncharacterized protein LOC107398835 n=1 Tax=Tribolium castaneum TaxID=7070 RepID=UPI00077DB348|nr:PREDICTED: uncharacterized protein LOC107398835 [Tribolium castaneum]|eukprot:XP_015839809.1 PREDICTED: uncharacterized protein LOC107398835 [Tribolium castaneum]
MFLYTSALFLLSWIKKIEGRTRNKPKICKFRSVDGPPYNYTWKTELCPNAWCCSHGCCPWYFNLTICVFIVVIIFSIIKIVEVWCKKPENSEENTEIHLNSAFLGDNYGTAPLTPLPPWTYPNYGFSSESLGRLAPPTDPAPSYDEVMGRKVDNQLHTK